MMIGTIAVSAFGGPVSPSPFGPSQPSAPPIQTSATTRPARVSSRSERARMKSRSSPAINSNASPTRGSMAVSVALRNSSSMTTNEMLLTRSGSWLPAASSLIVRSASSTRSSDVSTRRMPAVAMGVPSESVPVITARRSPMPGAPRTASICACVTDSKSSTWRAPCMS